MADMHVQDNEALKAELEEHSRIYEKICKSIRKQPGYVVDWQLVDKAWNTAMRLHRTQRRQSGEPYIVHPRSVMEELAKLRCKSSVLAAALLHDTMEDCCLTFEELREDFSYEVAQIVAAVTKIKASEKEADPLYASMNRDERRAFLDTLTDAKLIASPYQREAFLVRFADRVHNLATISHCKTGKRLEKIASTRAFLIPAAKKLGMRYFEVVLSDLCMKYESEDYTCNESVDLLTRRNALTRVSGIAHSRFDQAMQFALEDQSVFSLPTFNPFAKLRGFSGDEGGEMLTTPRRVMLAWELKQQLEKCRYFERSYLDLWEIVLTYKDRDSHNLLEHFVEMYRRNLKAQDIYMEYVGMEQEAHVIRLSDLYDNNYRVVLVNESRLEAYFIGDPKGERLTMIDEEAPGDALRPKITVWSYTPDKGYRRHSKRVPYGATALDFAFIINYSLALTVKSARIHTWAGEDTKPFTDSDYAYPLRTVLNEGDVVFFEADYHPKAEIDGQLVWDGMENVNVAKMDWFSQINTDHAKNCLIRYFNEKYEGRQ